MLQQIKNKIFSGIRITGEEGLWLLREAELLDLVPLADYWRQKHNPNKYVSYVVDTNLNYTNLCDAY
ncbi:MAG TPA: dehypoxanthine futalosine cyclase, partial [Acidobacteria bacterium]|nr:dehypoxanthine futalosine cyclase [Acidobacteriota bacterium]